MRLRQGHSRFQRQAISWRHRIGLAIAAGIAAVVVALGWWAATRSPEAQLVATIRSEEQGNLWRIEALSGKETLRVTAGAKLPLDATHAYELWALSESGAPVSLGLMPLVGQRTLALSPSQHRAFAAAHRLAISREPPGGSTTGAPTGPVLFVAEVLIRG